MYCRIENPKFIYYSWLGLLPPLHSYDLPDCSDDSVNKSVEAINEHFEWYCRREQNHITNARAYDEGQSPSTRFPPWIPAIALNCDQALQVIYHLNKKVKLLGALHIPDINVILFQTEFCGIGLEYGQEDLGVFLLHFKFDEHFGFTPPKEPLPSDEKEFIGKITLILQEYYLKWRSNNCDGNIIPGQQNCFLKDNTPSITKTEKRETSYYDYAKYAGAGAAIFGLGFFASRLLHHNDVAQGISSFYPDNKV